MENLSASSLEKDVCADTLSPYPEKKSPGKWYTGQITVGHFFSRYTHTSTENYDTLSCVHEHTIHCI